MPTRKKSSTKKSSSSRRKTTNTRTSNSNGYQASYDTQMIITVLLLLFVYPLGVIFMWSWMRNWPVWLKIIITLPVFLFILSVFFIMFVLRAAFRDASYRAWVLEHNKGNYVIPMQKPSGNTNLKYY